ncbi:MAG TPA: hypothetical protein VK781_13625, partial [Solirubrobacteraceae bacterium]|nr:hypothetical protein [Solirubrobacteraceae bacterium]
MAAVAAGGALAPREALAQLLAARSSMSLPHAISGLPAGPGQPPIIARSAWAHGNAHPKVAP